MSVDNENGRTPNNDNAASGGLMPEWTRDGHLDEGTVHTWLDGAFDEAQASVVSAHVAQCDVCQRAVAEARGLIAGASRMVRALDAVPSNVVPQQDVARTASRIVASASVRMRDDISADGATADNAEASVATPMVMPMAAAPVTPPQVLRHREQTSSRRWYSQTITRAAAAVLLMVGASAVWQRRISVERGAVAATDSTVASAAPMPSAPAPTAESRSVNPTSESAPMPGARAMADVAAPDELRAKRAPMLRREVASVLRADSAAAPQKASVDATGNAVSTVAAAEAARPTPTTVPVAAPSALAGVARGVERVVERGVAGGTARAAGAVADRSADRSAERVSTDVSPRSALAADGPVVLGRLTGMQGRPLEGAIVSVVGNAALRVSSDTAGRFVIPLSADSGVLLVRRIGYEAARLQVAAAGRDTVRTVLSMKQSLQQLSEVAVTSVESAIGAPDGACYSVVPSTVPSSVRVPTYIAMSNATLASAMATQWFGWPTSRQGTPVLMSRGVDGLWIARTTSADAAVELALTHESNVWSGTASMRRGADVQVTRIRLTSVSSTMCK